MRLGLAEAVGVSDLQDSHLLLWRCPILSPKLECSSWPAGETVWLFGQQVSASVFLHLFVFSQACDAERPEWMETEPVNKIEVAFLS